ncbi:MAG: HAMP domain-containing protein [Burkholderiales bacterium]|nr:HAMP domain-containing protein [Burkholderiales bacterium]
MPDDLKAGDSSKRHSLLIEKLYKHVAMIADRSGLTLDPEVDAYYLVGLFSKSLPEIAEGLSEVAGRGASYIDTALLEPNEDVMLNSAVMIARRDLTKLVSHTEAMFRANPESKPALEPHLASVKVALAFLERAKNEVLNAYNQSGGSGFASAGMQSVDKLYAFASASGAMLDKALDERIEKCVTRRNLVILSVMLLLAMGAYLLAGFYASFTSDVKALSLAVEKAASGDLTARISSEGRDEIAELLNAFGEMNEGLAKMVEQVRIGTEAIAAASHEIASGNADLSLRTEEQAVALQQTAVSMDSMIQTVLENAGRACQANEVVMSASDMARKGGAVVARAVETMGSISQSSKKIGDIISVIDGIAFQTNILALNAAVEAAHAGEGGKGFGVVASEVRNLAHRTAAAAKEIKLLILESADKADAGSKQINEAGSTMNDVVSSVKKATTIMHEISSASDEQSRGVESVTQAVSQMDALTMQNAAMVQQAAAAAKSMLDQAKVLSKAVSAFRIEESNAPRIGLSVLENIVALPAERNSEENKREIGDRRAAAYQKAALAVAGDSDWKEYR